MTPFAVRLEPGTDLRDALAEYVLERNIRAGIILSGVGSLHCPTLRYANNHAHTQLDGYFEILSLSGTLSCTGNHIHMMIADSKGKCYGGHLVTGCRVYTTAEIVMAELPGWNFSREPDERTGHRELKVRREE